MRIRTVWFAALFLSAATTVRGQDTADPRPRLELDFGVQATAFADGSDEARFQRYRDLRNGPFLTRLRYSNEDDRLATTFQADKVGYRDQRFALGLNRIGKLKASFEWNQIPLFISQDTRTLYQSTSPGVFEIADPLQSGLQARTLTLAGIASQATLFDTRSRRDVADLRLVYLVTPALDVNVGVRHTMREGNQLWSGTFGFGNAVEFPVPIETANTDVGAGFEWASGGAVVRVGYDGSFFHNDVGTLVWDNPLVATDAATGGGSRGRMALWPSSTVNSGSIMASAPLPARSRATAYVSVGNWSQNEPLIPFTINSALPAIPLDRATADASARVTSMNYSFTSRPTNTLWFNTRFRTYEFDNRTPVFVAGTTVNYDTSVAVLEHGQTHAYGYERRNFDAEASFTPWRSSAFRLGYTLEDVNRTFRVFDNTTEHIVRASIDTTARGWLSLRAQFEHGRRTGSGLDEEALDDIGEQVSLRQFDISDRTSNKVTGLVYLTPLPSVSFNANVSVGDEDRTEAVFGLRSNDNYALGFGVDVVPGDKVSAGLAYQFEQYSALQRSRQANPGVQFNDPTRDWTTDTDDTTHTVTASADFTNVVPRTTIRFAYDYSRAESLYEYGLAPNSTLAVPVQLPAVLNRFNRATADVRYSLNRRWALGLVYMYDDYEVNDFAFSPATITSIAQPSFLTLGYLFRPYTANTVLARATYLW